MRATAMFMCIYGKYQIYRFLKFGNSWIYRAKKLKITQRKYIDFVNFHVAMYIYKNRIYSTQ